MGRWRPPPPHSTALITADGMRVLQAELDDLWRVKRPEVVRALSAAAAEGDRSENAEYIYRKKQLGEIDRRVRYLSKRIPALRVVSDPPSDAACAFFGACVEVEDVESGECLRYRIVGPDETDAVEGAISIDSPMARALLKRRINEAFEVELPAGKRSFVINAVAYPDHSSNGTSP